MVIKGQTNNLQEDQKQKRRWLMKNRWMPHYEMKYGIEPIEFNSNPLSDGNLTVLKAKCRFCELYGRESSQDSNLMQSQSSNIPLDEMNVIDNINLHSPERKRRRKRQTVKYFGPNFRSDNIESHLQREHMIKWNQYERLNDDEKRTIFNIDKHSSLHTQGDNISMVFQMQETEVVSPAIIDMKRMEGIAKHANIFDNKISLEKQQELLMPSTMPAKHGLQISIHNDLFQILLVLLSNSFVLTNSDIICHDLNDSSNLMDKQLVDAQEINALSPTFADDHGDRIAWSTFIRVDKAYRSPLRLFESFKSIESSGKSTYLKSLTLSQTEVLEYFASNIERSGFPLDMVVWLVTAQSHWGAIMPGRDLPTCDTQLLQLLVYMIPANLSIIGMMMQRIWGYTLSLTFMTKNSCGFVDICVQVPFNYSTQNVHIMSLPLRLNTQIQSTTSYTKSEQLAQAVSKILRNCDPRAGKKIVGIVIDGDIYHMQSYSNIGTALKEQIAKESGNIVSPYEIGSGQILLSYIMEKVLDIFECKYQFITLLNRLYFAVQEDVHVLQLCHAMPTILELAILPHWLRIHKMCEWVAIHRDILSKWCSRQSNIKDSSHMLLSPPWWISVFLLRKLLTDIQRPYGEYTQLFPTFGGLQYILRNTIQQLRHQFSVFTTLQTSTCRQENAVDDINETKLPNEIANEDFTYQAFVDAVISYDLYLYDVFKVKNLENVDDQTRYDIFKHFNHAVITLIHDIERILAASPTASSTNSLYSLEKASKSYYQNIVSNNNIEVENDNIFGTALNVIQSLKTKMELCKSLPPITPLEFIKMDNVLFMEHLNANQSRIKDVFGSNMLSIITDERIRMITEFSRKTEFHHKVLGQDVQLQAPIMNRHANKWFQTAWEGIHVNYPSLYNFAAAFLGCLMLPSAKMFEKPRVFQSYAAQEFRISNIVLEIHAHAEQFLALQKLHSQLKEISAFV